MRNLYPHTLVIRGVICVGHACFLAWFFYRDARAVLFIWPVALLTFTMELEALKKKKSLLVESMFQEFMVSLSAALRAGYSLPNGFEEAYKEMSYMHGEHHFLLRELARIIRGMKEGKRCEQMLEDVGKDLYCNSMEELGKTLKVATLTGGNINKILCRTVQTLQQKNALRQDIEDSMSGRKYEATLMEIVPFALVLYVECGNPGFFEVLYGNVYGTVVMTICLLSYLTAKGWMHGIVSRAMEV